MAFSVNPPRSRHKRAAWEAERQRRERCGLSTERINAPVQSRSLSLRAASFKESVPESSAFKRGSVQRPKQKRDDRIDNRFAQIAAANGHVDIMQIIKRPR